MYRTLRGPVVALLGLAVLLSTPLVAEAAKSTRLVAPADSAQGEFSRAEARDLLAEATEQLRPEPPSGSAPDPQSPDPQTPDETGHRHEDGHEDGHANESAELTMTLRDLFLARSALSAADRRRADAVLARPTDRDGDDLGGPSPVAYPTTGRKYWCPTGGVACIHWVTSGPERISTADADADTVPDYVETVYATMKQVWDYEVGKLGFRPPLPDGGLAGNPDNPNDSVDIYLADLGSRGLYGYCVPEGLLGVHQLPGYCVLDNNYTDRAYARSGTSPINALRVTAAHEFFHVVQFGYDVDEDSWMMEGTATWIEDEVYDSINDNLQFLDESPLRYPRTPLDYSAGGHRYGSFLFFKYAAERLRDPNVVRQFWEQAEASRNRYSLQAIRAVIAARKTSWPAFFAVFNSWNTLPGGSYSERGAYPAPYLTMNRTLSKRSRSTGWSSVNLPHLASSAIKVSPHPKLRKRAKLTIEVNLPDSARGSAALLQRRYRNGAVTHAMIPLNAAGNGRVRTAFNRRSIASMVVVVSNTSTTMRDCGTLRDSYGGPVYSCYGRGWYDAGQTFSVRASAR